MRRIHSIVFFSFMRSHFVSVFSLLVLLYPLVPRKRAEENTNNFFDSQPISFCLLYFHIRCIGQCNKLSGSLDLQAIIHLNFGANRIEVKVIVLYFFSILRAYAIINNVFRILSTRCPAVRYAWTMQHGICTLYI